MTKEKLELLLEEKEIERVLFSYAAYCDTKNWSFLDKIFTQDAVAIYGSEEEGMKCKGLDEIRSFLQKSLEKVISAQHLIGNIEIQIDGKSATAKSFLAALQMNEEDGNIKSSEVWGQYIDSLVKENGNWKIKEKKLNIIYGRQQ